MVRLAWAITWWRKSTTPQGGILSPILSNVYLDQLDIELKKRGHKIVRFANGFCVYVKRRMIGLRVLESSTKYSE